MNVLSVREAWIQQHLVHVVCRRHRTSELPNNYYYLENADNGNVISWKTSLDNLSGSSTLTAVLNCTTQVLGETHCRGLPDNPQRPSAVESDVSFAPDPDTVGNHLLSLTMSQASQALSLAVLASYWGRLLPTHSNAFLAVPFPNTPGPTVGHLEAHSLALRFSSLILHSMSTATSHTHMWIGSRIQGLHVHRDAELLTKNHSATPRWPGTLTFPSLSLVCHSPLYLPPFPWIVPKYSISFTFNDL